MKHFRNSVFEVIEDDIRESLLHTIVEGFIVTLIILNAVAVILELLIGSSVYFNIFETASIIIFTVEYILRIWTADIKYPSRNKLISIVRFIFSPMGLVDLLSILPFYTSKIFLGVDARIVRILRLMRLLRLLKLTRHLDSIRLVKTVVYKKKHELFVTAFIVFLLLIISSTLMYEIEHDAQPDKFPNVLSAFWWSIATLTTIGYGDVYPITSLGKVISAMISLIGIGFIALPTGIISSGFIDEFRDAYKAKEEKEEEEEYSYCPHCGKILDH
jgi:voltage-gated potassium channel